MLTKFPKLIIFYSIWLSACSNTVMDVEYTSWEEANNDGLFARGWLPNWLPPTVINIKERHDLDTSKSTAVFELHKQERNIFFEKCKKTTQYEPPFYFKSDFKLLYEPNQTVLIYDNQFTILGDSLVVMWRP